MVEGLGVAVDEVVEPVDAATLVVGLGVAVLDGRVVLGFVAAIDPVEEVSFLPQAIQPGEAQPPEPQPPTLQPVVEIAVPTATLNTRERNIRERDVVHCMI